LESSSDEELSFDDDSDDEDCLRFL